MGETSVLLVEIGFQELLCKAGSYGRNTVQRVVVQCSLLPEGQVAREARVEMTAWLFFTFEPSWPPGALVGAFSLRVHTDEDELNSAALHLACRVTPVCTCPSSQERTCQFTSDNESRAARIGPDSARKRHGPLFCWTVGIGMHWTSRASLLSTVLPLVHLLSASKTILQLLLLCSPLIYRFMNF